MKKKVVLILWVLMCISLCACEQGVTKNTDEQTIIQNNEKDTVDLSSAQFWIDQLDDADAVVMTNEEINTQNELLMTTWGTDWTSGYYDVKAFPEKVDGEWLKDRICYLDLKNTNLFFKGKSISENQWELYYDNVNLESIPEEKTVSYAVICENTSSLDLPTEDIFTDSGMNEKFNRIQQTAFKVNEPVVVLQESLDNKWVFAVANEYIGWVKKEDCAFFKTRQEWIDYQDREKFIMITEDSSVPEIEFTLFMGTKLYLADDSLDETSAEYKVIIPKSDDNGMIQYEELFIPKGDNVSEGYLPFTKEYVIKLAFQELGDPYGWGSADGQRDCSSYVKDIYTCFGFRLPRNSWMQQTMPGLSSDISSLSDVERENYMEKMSTGDLLGFRGHIMIYLGKANDKHYIINMLSSYVPEEVTEDFENSVVSVSQVMVNSLNVRRKNGNTWLQELKGVVHFD